MAIDEVELNALIEVRKNLKAVGCKFPCSNRLYKLESKRIRQMFVSIPVFRVRCSPTKADFVSFGSRENSILLIQEPSSFIKQSHSWSRFHITPFAFEKLLILCRVPSGFLDFVHSFGYRSKDTDTNFGGYIRNISWSTNSLSNGRISDISSDSTLRPYLKSAELGYHIRYPEDYKNDLPDSWVIRQLAVSETFDCEAHNSAWLILQCPTTLRKKLQDIGFPEAVSEHDANKGSRLMMFHILILESVAQKWRTYIEYLEKMIEETVSWL